MTVEWFGRRAMLSNRSTPVHCQARCANLTTGVTRMSSERIVRVAGVELQPSEQRYIDHQFDLLDRRLSHYAQPTVVLALTGHPGSRLVEADLRVQLSPLGNHLISKQAAETVDRAVRIAVKDVERQLERRHATQRGEPAYGVPSRRLPASLRPSSVSAEQLPDESSEP